MTTAPTPLRFGVVVAVLMAVCSRPVSAQTVSTPTQPPIRQLFGPNNPPVDLRQSLNVRFSPLGAYERQLDTLNLEVAPVDALLVLDGPYSAADLSAEYSRSGRRVNLRGEFGSSSRYYPDVGNFFTLGQSAGFGAVIQTGERTRAQVEQRWRYAPYFTMGVFPEVAPPPLGADLPVNTDYAVTRRAVTSLETLGNLQRTLSNRSTFVLDYGFSRFSDFTAHRAGFLLNHQFGRRSRLDTGYRAQIARFDLPEQNLGQASSHQLMVGVEHVWVRSATRQSRIRLEGGPSMVNSRGWVPDFFGGVEFEHSIARGWNAAAALRRSVGFVDGFGAPFVSEGGTVQLGGAVGSRVDLGLNASYVRGWLRTGVPQAPMRTAVGSGRLGFAATRHVALFAQYIYYYYDFGANVGVPGEYVRALNRTGIRVGVDLWLSLIEQRRRDDSR